MWTRIALARLFEFEADCDSFFEGLITRIQFANALEARAKPRAIGELNCKAGTSVHFQDYWPIARIDHNVGADIAEARFVGCANRRVERL